METFGDRIKLVRKERGLTLDEVAKLAGKAGKSAVSQWENDITKNINGINLVNLAAALNVNPLWLLTGKVLKTPVKEQNPNIQVLNSLNISQIKKIKEQTAFVNGIKFSKLSILETPLNLSQGELELLLIDSKDIPRKITSNCFIVEIDNDRFQQHNFFNGDYIVIDTEIDPVDSDTLLICFKPDDKYTFAKRFTMGKRVFLTILENDYHQPFDATDIDFIVLGVAFAQSRRTKLINPR